MALRPRWAASNAILPSTPASLASLSPPGSSGHHGTFKNVGYPHQLGRDHGNGGEGEDEGDGEANEGKGEEGDSDDVNDNDNIVVSTIAIAVIAGEAEEGMERMGVGDDLFPPPPHPHVCLAVHTITHARPW